MHDLPSNMPLGATLTPAGVAFRLWAPHALQVYLLRNHALRLAGRPDFVPSPDDAMVPMGDGTWGAFASDLDEGAAYRFWIVGTGSTGLKRDPRARELSVEPAYPDCDCVVHDPSSYPWHDALYRPPEFRDLVLYQLHIGSYYACDADGEDCRRGVGKFLDLLDRIDYLRELGVNGVQLLPIHELRGPTSEGYRGVDLYSPETDYQITDDDELDRYLWKANALLARAGCRPLTVEQLHAGPDQLRCVIDIFHLNGIAVLFDLVLGHAGPSFDDQSIRFLDRQPVGDDDRSLYFTHQTSAGGNVFAFRDSHVRAFLADNVMQWCDEFHIDGIRYDDASAIEAHGGSRLCHELTATARLVRPQAIQIAEYWGADRATAVRPAPDGLGFDAAWGDRLRDGIRTSIAQAAQGPGAHVDMAALADAFATPDGFGDAWRVVNCIEDHGSVLDGRGRRLPWLADPVNPRSVQARARSRIATGLLLAGRGIPQLFMGQEILEDKPWSDAVTTHPHLLIWWDGLQHDRAMRDHLAFCRDLIRLRRTLPALRSEYLRVSTCNAFDRVIALHRWTADGQDVLFVANLQEQSRAGYRIGFPAAGGWRELLNSDAYDGFPNRDAVGNGGYVTALPTAWDGMPASAAIQLPASGFVMFAR